MIQRGLKVTMSKRFCSIEIQRLNLCPIYPPVRTVVLQQLRQDVVCLPALLQVFGLANVHDFIVTPNPVDGTDSR